MIHTPEWVNMDTDLADYPFVTFLSGLGEPEKINLEAIRLGLDLSKANIVYPPTSPKLKEYAQLLFDLRKAKGVTIDAANDLAQVYICRKTKKKWVGAFMVTLKKMKGLRSDSKNIDRGYSHVRSSGVRNG